MKIIASFPILMQKARALGMAEETGDKEAILHAQKEHDEYMNICLKADEMMLGCTYGDLI